MIDGTGPVAAHLAGALTLAEASGALGPSGAVVVAALRRVGAGAGDLVPVDVDVEAGVVEMLDLSEADWSLPFFDDTVRAARQDQLGRTSVAVGVDVVLRAAERCASRPAGFIFHTGRCGSTLLSNLLAAGDPSSRVLKEPGVLNPVLVRHVLTCPADASIVTELLNALLVLLAGRSHPPGSAGSAAVHVKHVAWATGCGAVLMRRFPDTPAVMVFREPLASLASAMHSVPGWFDEVASWPAPLQARLLPSLRERTESSPVGALELLAHAWRSSAEDGLRLPRHRTHLVDYDELVAEPVTVVARVLAHLGRPALRRDGEARVLAESHRYAKDASGGRYDPVRRHRRPALVEADAESACSIASASWARVQAALRARNP